MWLLIQGLQSEPPQDHQLTGPVAALLQTSAESAMAIILMLKTLTEQDMLECFLPFQLEYGFSAAMLLSLMRAILPDYVPDTNWYRSVHLILDQMIAKKNVVARLRKTEMQELDTRLASVHKQLFAVPELSTIQVVTRDNAQSGVAAGVSDDVLIPPTSVPDLMPSSLQQAWDIDFAGIDDALFNNHDQMLDLAQQFQTGDWDASIFFASG